jgi:hypothetical protein
MTQAFVEFDPPQPDAPGFSSETAGLVYFLSWAYATRYGASHGLSIAAVLLRGQFKIDLSPLLTFADRSVEDESDSEALAGAWQDAAPLAECCAKVSNAFASGERRLVALQEEYPHLAGNIEDLGRMAAWATERGARIRLTYEIDGLV